MLAWAEAYRVLRPGGLLILNLKDHIRRGEVQRVTFWHISAAQELGFRCVDQIFVPSSKSQTLSRPASAMARTRACVCHTRRSTCSAGRININQQLRSTAVIVPRCGHLVSVLQSRRITASTFVEDIRDRQPRSCSLPARRPCAHLSQGSGRKADRTNDAISPDEIERGQVHHGGCLELQVLCTTSCDANSGILLNHRKYPIP